MTTKKILGIVLAVLFGGAFVIGVFTFIYYMVMMAGCAVWEAILLGLTPFIGAALVIGVIALILYLLLEDSNNKHSKKKM